MDKVAFKFKKAIKPAGDTLNPRVGDIYVIHGGKYSVSDIKGNTCSGYELTSEGLNKNPTPITLFSIDALPRHIKDGIVHKLVNSG